MTHDEQRVLSAVAHVQAASSGWARVACPFCPAKHGSEDRKRSFGFNAATGRYSCFRCGTRGRVREVPEPLDLPRRPEAAPAADLGPPETYAPLGEYPALNAVCYQEARDYLAGRGLGDPETWRRARIGACLGGVLAGRVVVPLPARDGSWGGWVARSWGPATRPYLYPKGMHRTLYNGAALDRVTDEPVLVVEGVFDALHVWPDAVALLGKATREHAEALRNSARPVAVVLDGDAHEEGWALAEWLRFMGVRAGSVRLPPKMDPDEIPVDDLRKMAQASIA